MLIANASGNTVAAHIGVCADNPCTAFVNNGTGFATNGPPGVIPEPATWAMMILGFGGIGAMIRRIEPCEPVDPGGRLSSGNPSWRICTPVSFS